VAAPLPRKPLPLELLDPVRRDFVQDERPEGAIEYVDDFPIAIDIALVLLGVVGQVPIGE
jgi:hypothetical protein